MAGLNLTRYDLLSIAAEINIFKVMGERRIRSLTVDFVPYRAAIALARLPGDEPLTTCAAHVEEIVYHLEDTMFGGEVYASLTARGMVLITPFPWKSFEALARNEIVLPRNDGASK